MDISFLFPRRVDSAVAGLEEAKNPAGKVLRLIQIFLTPPSFEKISPACRGNSPQVQIANSSLVNAVSISSARTTKRFPSSRCASAIQFARWNQSLKRSPN
jgi:hypothetical protein